MWLISALSLCDSVKYIYPRCHPTAMFFVATREVVLVVHTRQRTRSVTHTQSRIDTLHGLLFGVMDDRGVKTCIDTFNHCAPPIKHCIIRSFM